MSELKFRFACMADVPLLAAAHLASSAKQPGGFMFRLGRRFLLQYWRLILLEKYSVIICAENADGEFLGFVSGTIDAAERQRTLRNNRISLGVAALPAILKTPKLLKEMISRQGSKSADDDDKAYVVQSGAREDFWSWLQENTAGALDLHLKWLAVMRSLGVQAVRGEVDRVNSFVYKTHKMLGARVIKEFVTPDGKERLVMEYRLQK